MRIPRYQYTQGTALSARSTPVLRRDPSLRPNVMRKPVYNDPEAGKANMGLEVQAAGRGQYVIGAVTKGVSDFTNILLKLETDQQATQAYYDLKSKAETELSNMKDEAISRPVNVLNPDGSINETLIPTYKSSATDFQNDLLVERKRIAATLNRTASNAFARSSIDVMVSANAQAAAYNRKQAIAWTEGAAWKTLMAARTHEDVEDIAVLDFFKSSMGPLKFEKMVYERHRGIAVDTIKAAIYKARIGRDETELNIIRRAVLGKGKYSYYSLGEYGKDDGKRVGRSVTKFAPEYQYLKYGVDGDDEKLLSILDSYQKEIRDERDRFLNDNVNNELASFLNHKDSWMIKEGDARYDSPLDKIDDLLDKNFIDADGYTKLKNAIIAEETGPQYSQPGIYGDILESIGDYSFEDISVANLTTAEKNSLTQQKITYNQQVSRWDTASNPAGDEGYQALQLLRSEYGISVAGIASSMDAGLRQQQSIGWAMSQKELRLYMMGRIPNKWDNKLLDVPEEQKPMAAFEWVMHHLEGRRKPDGTRKDQSLGGNGGDQTPGRLGLPPNQLANLKQFESEFLQDGQTIEEVIKGGGEQAKKVLQAISLPPFNIAVSDAELEKIGVDESWEELIDDPSFWDKVKNITPGLGF